MKKTGRTFFYFTFPLAVLILCVSWLGLNDPGIYGMEAPQWHAQCTGQDILDICLVTPVLVLSALLSFRGNKVFFFIYGGTILYIAYTFVIYCFSVHYNYLFVPYCFVLGLAVYAFVHFISAAQRLSVEKWFDEKTPVKLTGNYLLIPASLFYFLWLMTDVPASFNKAIPAEVLTNGLVTNPVHVLDLALFLPGLVITAILLIKRKSLGYLLAPVMLVFFILMNITIAALALIMSMNAVSGSGLAVVWIMSAFALTSIAMLFLFSGHLKKEEHRDTRIPYEN